MIKKIFQFCQYFHLKLWSHMLSACAWWQQWKLPGKLMSSYWDLLVRICIVVPPFQLHWSKPYCWTHRKQAFLFCLDVWVTGEDGGRQESILGGWTHERWTARSVQRRITGYIYFRVYSMTSWKDIQRRLLILENRTRQGHCEGVVF